MRNRMIRKHTVSPRIAARMMNAIVRSATTGAIPPDQVIAAPRAALARERDTNGAALIRAASAIAIARALPHNAVRHRLIAGLWTATFDTWNLGENNAPDYLTCMYGSFGDVLGGPLILRSDLPADIRKSCADWAIERETREPHNWVIDIE